MDVGSFTIILTPLSIFPTVFTQEIVALAVEMRSYFYKMGLLWRSSVGVILWQITNKKGPA
jgi:hypothetical protein